MKKFLTVLLALSVVFTYTVGTAFAANEVTGTPSELTHEQAMRQAVSELKTELNKAVVDAKGDLKGAYTEKINTYDVEISKEAYAATIDMIETDLLKVIDNAAKAVDDAEDTKAENDVDTLKLAIAGEKVDDVIFYNGKVEGEEVALTDIVGYTGGIDKYVTATPNSADTDKNVKYYYYVQTLANALPEIQDYLINDVLAKVDLKLYADVVANESDVFNKTWKDLAKTKVEELENVVNETKINRENSWTAAKNAVTAAYNIFESIEEEKVTTSGYVVSYKLAEDLGILTAEELGIDNATTEAEKAALKAEVQKNAANALAENVGKDNFKEIKEIIDAYVEVWNTLIDADKVPSDKYPTVTDDPTRADYKDCVDDYKVAEKMAAALKLEVEKDGTLKYDGSVINEKLKDVKVAIYSGTTYTEVALRAALIDDAAITSDNLAWEKEVAVAQLNEDMEAILDDYYAPEQEAIKALYQKVADKYNAAATSAQLEALIDAEEPVSVPTSIWKKTVVDSKVEGYVNTGKFEQAVQKYVDALNTPYDRFDEEFRGAVKTADVVEYLVEKGARTNADVAKYLADAEEFAKSLPTNGEIEAATNAAKTLIDALPKYITLADKDAVKAAYDAAEAADYTSTKLDKAVEQIMLYEKEAIDDMIDALPKVLTAADKATVDAIFDAIDAFNDEEMYDGYADYSDTDVVTAFKDVRAAALADVQKAIAAISANPTASEVEAARAAVDAFVATYTDATEPYQAIAEIVNLDKLTYAEAQVKANMIDAVQGLKIKASSSAVKGKITVKWTVKGDVPAGTVYKVYKSTKAQSGYAYMGKTTKNYMANKKNLKKGKRYFYKVKAVLVVDGQTYTSDWSNKANRFAK